MGRAIRRTAVGLALLASVLIAALLWPAASAPLPDLERAYMISNVHVIDVESGTADALGSVTIRNGRIEAFGSASPQLGLPVIDGQGGYLIPGLWDMHVHSFQLSPQMHLPLFVANGITSVRDMMGCPARRDSLIACTSDKRRWNAAVDAGELTSPRFVSLASYYFESPALTPAEVSQRARAAAAAGTDELKVYNRLSRPAYARVAEEARRNRMRLVGHLPKAISLDEALVAGQSSFEHAHLLPRHCFGRASDWRGGKLDAVPPTLLIEALVAKHDPDVCRAAFASMKTAGVWLVPTHVTREEDARAGDPRFIDDERLAYLDPLSRWAYRDDFSGTRSRYPGERGEVALRRYFEHGLRLTGAAHAAGVPILVGTDTAIGGFRYHDELEHLVRAGLTPAEVLRAATIDAARYTGLDRSSGSVKPGKRADLVLLDANPLSDVRNMRRIRAVMIEGRIYDRQRLDALLRFTRSQAARPDNWVKLLWGFARSSVASDL